MHPLVYRQFEHLFDTYKPPGPDVLEIGASDDPAEALLTAFQALPGGYNCVGVNLSVSPGLELPYRMVKSNANDMAVFPDHSFDAIACNAVLEHDRMFWRTLAEVRRLLRPGGIFYVGVPGFPQQRNLLQRAFMLVPRSPRLRAIPGLQRLAGAAALTSLAATRTFMFHPHPHDFYRFSEQAVRSVFLEGMECLHLAYVLRPVRILAVGRKPV